jgi:hypothetical protein
MSKLPTLLESGSLYIHGIQQSQIPIDYITGWIKERMYEFGNKVYTIPNRILIIVSETGSGKSTVIPVYLFRILRGKDTPKNIRLQSAGVICTQPRVLTAIALAADVSSTHSPWNPDMISGVTLGFQTGVISEKPESGLIYATSGVLSVQLQQQKDSEIINNYKFIIVDEAHERSTASDLMIMLLKNFYIRNEGNPKLPFLILMSATIEPYKYLNYFKLTQENVIEVKGRLYEIITKWPSKGTNNYLIDSAKTAISIHEESKDDDPDKADILIFVPGFGEAVSIAQMLVKANIKYVRSNESNIGPMLVLLVNRDVIASQTGHYPLVFEKVDKLPTVGGKKPIRRVIVSTVVAETGLTIDTLKYVIDCGWSRTKETYQPYGVKGLVTRPAPKSRIKQRKGRVGRLFPGVFYPMYTENVYDVLEDWQLPDIITGGIDDIFLSLVKEQHRQKIYLQQFPEFKFEDISLIDIPSAESLLYSNHIATSLGFVSNKTQLAIEWPPKILSDNNSLLEKLSDKIGIGLTKLGYIASMFTRVDMEGIRVLLSGYLWDVSMSDLITIVSLFGHKYDDIFNIKEKQNLNNLGATALRASAPIFLSKRSGGSLNDITPPSESELSFLRTKMVISDEFIEIVLIYDAFSQAVMFSDTDPIAIYSWCSNLGLNFETMISLTKRRTSIIEEMILAGLNPYRNDDMRIRQSNINNFSSILISLKKCIYAGLKNNLLTYIDDGYISKQGIKLKSPAFLSDNMISKLNYLGLLSDGSILNKPKYLVTDNMKLGISHKPESDITQFTSYVVNMGFYSVIDGYVNPDIEIEWPRIFY